MGTCENFPVWIVLLSNFVAIGIYASGAYILAGFGVLTAVLYLLYCAWIEIRLLRGGCVDCYYYGKICAFGRGRLCSLFFGKGDPRRFVEREFSWSMILPDLMVSVLPFVGGIVLLVRDFVWPLVGALAVLVALSTGGNVVVRGSFACKYCKQRELGCPAEEAFRKGEMQNC